MFSVLKNGWSINIFYYLREMISFDEGQRVIISLLLIKRFCRASFFRLEKESKLDTGMTRSQQDNEPSFASLLRTKSLRLSQGK